MLVRSAAIERCLFGFLQRILTASRSFFVLAINRRFAPNSARATAASAPSPLEAPVTIIFLFFISGNILLIAHVKVYNSSAAFSLPHKINSIINLIQADNMGYHLA